MNQAILELIKSFIKSQGITRGLSQEQHTAIVRDCIVEQIFTDYSKEALDTAPVLPEQVKGEPSTREAGVVYQQDIKKVRAELYAMLYPLMNGSALRQQLETAGVLAKSEGGRKSADARVLANKYS